MFITQKTVHKLPWLGNSAVYPPWDGILYVSFQAEQYKILSWVEVQ